MENSLCLRICIIIFLVQYSTASSFLNKNMSMTNNNNIHLCRQDQSQLLLHLKQEFPASDPHKYYKTKYWNRGSDCCKWDGVTCDDFTGHVIALDLSRDPLNRSRSFLSGELNSNSSLFHLTHLRSLNLAYNHFYGSEILSEFTRLNALTHLNLASNSFRGSEIPSEFGRLNALTHLDLSRTGIAGEIPMEFYHLSNLVSLDLSAAVRQPCGIISFSATFCNYYVSCDVKMLLWNMTRLRVLLLTRQNLSSSELPMNMSSFLTHLDLEDTGVRGELPATIFEKPNLQILRLGGNEGLKGSLPNTLNRSNVNSFKVLDLHRTSISSRLPDSIGLMTSLTYMDLSQTSISGRLPDSIGLTTSLNYMDLSETSVSGRLPDSIGLLTNLNSMDLSNCKFWGPIPESIRNITAITSIDLSHNEFSGRLPDAFSGFQNLYFLDLSYNNLEGRIPSSLTNMSQLSRLDISSNALTGPFPSKAGHGLQEIYEMDFSNNSIQGTIPPWLFSLPSLRSLYLSSNRLEGGIGKLNSQALKELELSSNGLNIELQSNIQYLDISYNKVTEHDGDDIVNVTFPSLKRLEMSSCEIKEFPNFLRGNMRFLTHLDLSNNKIHSRVPSWFSSNLPLDLYYLDLHANSIWGTFPSSICNMTQLYLLNLSNNKLSGNIPECLANSSGSLEVLDLRRNEFHGKIPTKIGTMYELTYLGLNGNHLEGALPPSLANCTGLEVIDLGNNMLQDTFPGWLHTLPHLKILILKSNNFHGSITSPAFTDDSFNNLQILDLSYNNFTGLLPKKLFASLQAIKHQTQASTDNGLYMGENNFGNYEYSVTLSVKGVDVEFIKVLKIFTTVDLSSNNFNGSIPDSLSNLTSLRLLNLSHNSIHDNIPPTLGRMTHLEHLDLSSNQLMGGIPQTLTNLTFLAALNLSHNHLIGPIPQGSQFSTFSNDSYAENSGLCGAPLTKICGNEREASSLGEDDEDEEEEESGFTWKEVVIGYGCGIVLGFILGNVMISMEKPKWLARFVYAEAQIILRRRNNKRRMVHRRRS